MTPTKNPVDAYGVPYKWLHLYMLSRDRGGDLSMHQQPLDNVAAHCSYPWMFEEEAPCFQSLTAWWHITGFEGMPSQWADFWFELRAMKRAALDYNHQYHPHPQGPYWMLTPRYGAASVAQTLVGIMNRTRTMLFRENRGDYVDNPSQHLGDVLESILSPQLITNLGEEFDETERPDEKRRGTVQQWHSAPPNRPPGSRQV